MELVEGMEAWPGSRPRLMLRPPPDRVLDTDLVRIGIDIGWFWPVPLPAVGGCAPPSDRRLLSRLSIGPSAECTPFTDPPATLAGGVGAPPITGYRGCCCCYC